MSIRSQGMLLTCGSTPPMQWLPNTVAATGAEEVTNRKLRPGQRPLLNQQYMVGTLPSLHDPGPQILRLAKCATFVSRPHVAIQFNEDPHMAPHPPAPTSHIPQRPCWSRGLVQLSALPLR